MKGFACLVPDLAWLPKGWRVLNQEGCAGESGCCAESAFEHCLLTSFTAAAAAVDTHRENDLVLLEIKINGELASPLSVICHRWVAWPLFFLGQGAGGGWFEFELALCLTQHVLL